MPDFWNSIIGDHSLVAFWLSLLFLLTIFLGGLKVCRLFLRCLILFVREIKHELRGSWEALRDLAKEFADWKNDP